MSLPTQEVNMKSGGYFAVLGYFATRLVVIEIVILALTGLVCWWIGHWTLAGYSNGLSWAGGVVILFGLINLFGGSEPTATMGTRYNFGFIAMRNATPGLDKPIIQNLEGNQLSAIFAGLAGIATFVIGAIIKIFIA